MGALAPSEKQDLESGSCGKKCGSVGHRGLQHEGLEAAAVGWAARIQAGVTGQGLVLSASH